MSDRKARLYEMGDRVQTFGKDNTADFAAGSKAAGHFASVEQIIKDLDTAKAGQPGGTAKEVLSQPGIRHQTGRFPSSLLKNPFQRRRRDMFIDDASGKYASSVGATCAGNQA